LLSTTGSVPTGAVNSLVNSSLQRPVIAGAGYGGGDEHIGGGVAVFARGEFVPAS
jgi:hypothetical protein